jgi:hypothetical protein
VTYEDHFNGTGKQTVTAPMVFLAGGVLGSTEILLRSAKKGFLPLNSDVLGSKFSTNGDFGAFCYKTQKPVYSTRGPINTCHVQLNFNGKFIKIEDCAVPSMFAEFVAKGLEVLDNLGGIQLARTIRTVSSMRSDRSSTAANQRGVQMCSIASLSSMGR